MKKIFGAVLLTAVILFPLACGKSLSPTTTGPVTIVQVVPTATSTFTNANTPTNTPTTTPNPFGGFVWSSHHQRRFPRAGFPDRHCL
jgi:hypothetical protein